MDTVNGPGCEATEPLIFYDEPILATVGLVGVSRPSGGFLKVNPGSCFQEFDMLKLRYMYQIPTDVEIHASHSHERVDSDAQGWWSFYEFAFEAGFKFPVPRLMRELLSHFQIAPQPMNA